ncbi:MAG: hypothetical protein IJ443_01935 [Firmicutes bacterium]|nr:hypothetical protein [Bacillota bacterium]
MSNVMSLLGLAAFIWVISLSSKVSRLERMLREDGIGKPDKSALRRMLKKGQHVVLEFEENADCIDLIMAECLVEDVDECWVLVRHLKKDTQHLVRIDSIAGVKLK